MYFYHTFWSKPALNSVRWNIKAQYFLCIFHTALSVAYLKNLGQKIELFADGKAAEILDFLPYDRVYRALDNHDVPLQFWASAKIKILEFVALDAVHIDTDFFVKDAKIVELCKENEFVISHKENTKKYKKLVKNVCQALDEASVSHPFAKNEKQSFNLGICKIGDPDFRKLYAQNYWRLALALFKNKRFFSEITENSDATFSPDLVIEQLLFKKICEHQKISPKKLIKSSELEFSNKKEIGFCHLLSFDKYLKIPQIMEKLKIVDAKIYRGVLKKLGEIGFSLRLPTGAFLGEKAKIKNF
jgi:hypothetical protein